MTHTMTVSPDFSPDYIAGWYIFNTWLQNQTKEAIHLELYESFEKQRNDIKSDKIDLIYANPYDASMLVREKGFVSVAAPYSSSDEAMICVNAESGISCVEDLKPQSNIAMADDPEVNTIGFIMLEPADLGTNNTKVIKLKNYVMVAKNLINGTADAGFFLKEAYAEMSNFIKSQIKPIITSEISVIRHSFLVGPNLAHKIEEIRDLLNGMHNNAKGKGVLDSLGFEKLENQSIEDSEFMIDLMDTLL